MPRLEITHEAMRHYYRGRVFESTGETDIAIEEYRKAIEMGADYADIHNSLGRAYAKKGLFHEASNEFKTALQLNPHYLEAQRNLFELETKLSLTEKQKDKIYESRGIRRVKAPKRPGGGITLPLKPLLYGAAAGGIAAIIIISAIFIPKLFPAGKVVTFTTPSENISGISIDGKTIWLCDWLKQEIYAAQIDGGELAVRKTYGMKTVFPVGASSARSYLWTCDAWSRRINKHMYDDSLSVMASFPSPGGNPCSLCFDGKTLWSVDSVSKMIYMHDMESPQLLPEKSIKSPCLKPIGFSFDGKNYWSVDAETKVIYKHNSDMSVSEQYQMNLVNKKLGAVLVDKKYIWIAFEGERQLIRYPKKKIIR
ncbi:MAG: hypothetical protein A2297_05280 [Elusimicrobia bacterium RIFOXYB2_FULL_48_7]|nr:MAG: hypothetical protein A2297_05280 [Elusimicrobia bacterium RIFOXYB2_FULL_48_7]